MAENPLVSGSVDTTTAFSGAGLLDSGSQLTLAISSGDWVDSGLAVVGVAIDAVATASDPLGSLIAAGLGWLIDHFEPLKGWFDDLTGDPGQVAGFAQTWDNVATALSGDGDELRRVLSDLQDMSGEAFDAYRRFQEVSAQHLQGAAQWASAMSTGMRIASQIVQVVHDLVRDILSQLIGSAISWAAEAVFSLGLATPWIIEQISTRVASWVARIGKEVTGVLKSLKDLGGLLERLRTLMHDVSSWLRGRFPETADSERGSLDLAAFFGRRQVAGDGLTDAERQAIIDTPKGSRPDPTTYLSPAYITQHLRQFDGGGTRFITGANLQKYGIAQSDGTSFIMPSAQVDALLRATGGDAAALEGALGLPAGQLATGMRRVDIASPGAYGLRMPSGNEAGANDLWLPGGHLPTGISEAVVDGAAVPPGAVTDSPFPP